MKNMKKTSFALGAFALTAAIILGGCNQLKEQAQDLRKSGETLVNQASQQAEAAKTQLIQTKAEIDQKVKDLQDAGQKVQEANAAIQKLGK